ncbi:fumarylacetoacetate hydrolase family protein [Nocardia brasiliensis]|uniref:fumarylacetoacetate hydrolase family protein n=1 Tax=Nocardia brasiliensis TaxID=37326 RepID=UPI002457746E|nr:fumarylacetoacetate hydrolase family protein [Nocardia brasiliensis]
MTPHRIRRTLNRKESRIDLHLDFGAGWMPADEGSATAPELGLPRGYTEEFEFARYEQLGLPHGATVLPVCPLSFRDFMLYETHAIDAARGMASRFLPAVHRVASAFESVTRRTFPPFRPNRLWYRQPIYYMSNALTVIPSGTAVRCPSYSAALDFELELGVVLGSPLRDATVNEAAAAIAAVVVINDFSARDVQLAEMRSGFGPQKSKHFRTSMSDIAVTDATVLDRIADLTASVQVNGKTVARTSTRAVRYSVPEAIAHASRDEQLFPGELIATGTLPGGSGMELGQWLRPGDRLRLEIDEVGVIEHHIGEANH